MNPIARYKRWKLWRDAAKAWRRATGGTMRYRWNIGGARAEFSAPDPSTLDDLLAHIEDFAKMLRAVHDGKTTEVTDEG